MIETNTVITEFVGGNFLAISGLLGLLKVLAVKSKNNFDNAIVSYLSGFFGNFRKGE